MTTASTTMMIMTGPDQEGHRERLGDRRSVPASLQYTSDMAETEAGEERIEIPEGDDALLDQCRLETFRSGGKGGQHQNATDSGVRLVHLPTGVRAESRTDRSQHRNRAIALERLRRKLEQRNERRPPRISTRVPAAERRKRLEAKRKRARLKASRRRPPPED